VKQTTVLSDLGSYVYCEKSTRRDGRQEQVLHLRVTTEGERNRRVELGSGRTENAYLRVQQTNDREQSSADQVRRTGPQVQTHVGYGKHLREEQHEEVE
jgi:hypothetical protein